MTEVSTAKIGSVGFPLHPPVVCPASTNTSYLVRFVLSVAPTVIELAAPAVIAVVLSTPASVQLCVVRCEGSRKYAALSVGEISTNSGEAPLNVSVILRAPVPSPVYVPIYTGPVVLIESLLRHAENAPPGRAPCT